MVSSHFPMWCTHRTMPSLPRLQVLRLNHVCDFHYPMGPETHCCHIPNATPEKLVVANVSPDQLACPIDRPNIHAPTPPLLDAMQEYVCLMDPPKSGPEAFDLDGKTPNTSLLANVPPNARRITIVFWTPNPLIQWRYCFPSDWLGPDQIPSTLRAAGGMLTGTWLGDMLARLAEIVVGSSRELCIVNSGGIRLSHVGPELREETEVQKKVEAQVRGYLGQRLNGTSELEEAQGRVSFAKMEEYMGTEASAGVFDEKELAMWRTDDCLTGPGR